MTFLSPTLPLSDCHNDFKLSHDILIIKIRVQRTYTQLLCILNEPKWYFGGGGLQGMKAFHEYVYIYIYVYIWL